MSKALNQVIQVEASKQKPFSISINMENKGNKTKGPSSKHV